MAYEAPGIRLRQRITRTSTSAGETRHAHIAGGHAFLVRYREASEKALGRLGYYVADDDVEYAWPHRPAQSKIDLGYTKLFIENGLLRYFHDTIGSGQPIVTVSGSRNRIRCNALSFKSNGDSYPRSPVFKDRDVAPGDVVKLRAVVGSEVYEMWSYVRALEADPVAASIGAAQADAGNHPSQSAPTPTHSKTAGPDNCVAIDSVDATNYDGLPSGRINETYTVEVILSSAGGNATTARLRVKSASGLDDQASIIPSPFGMPTPIGTRGLLVTWDLLNTAACSVSAEDDNVAPDDFIVGQKWVINCGQAFTATTATSGGTYTGQLDELYIVEVTRGGRFSSSQKPQITVTTARGTDRSGPTNVTGLATAVPVGSYGVTISFGGSTTGLRKGDKFLIQATAQGEGYVRQILLGHNLPDAVVDNGVTEVDLSLFIRKSFQIERERRGFAPLLNWDASENHLTVFGGLIAYDSSWTDNGVPLPLEVFSEPTRKYGELFVEYRAWHSQTAHEIMEFSDVSDLDRLSGDLTPDNPLKFGLYCALLNSHGVSVKATAVADPNNPDSWQQMLRLLEGRRDIYALAPLTFDPLVKTLYESHAMSQSGESKACFREVFLSQAPIRKLVVIDATKTANGQEALGRIIDNPAEPGTQYTLLVATNVDFVTAGVQPGDEVRTRYTTDGFGGETYSTYSVSHVVNENTLVLESGPSAALAVDQKFEIWRSLNPDQEIAALVQANTFGNRRVINIFPGEVVIGGQTVPGYYAAACTAGQVCGVEPHRSLTNMPVAGVSATPDANERFTPDHLNRLAESGYWIIWFDSLQGGIVHRHALTTAANGNLNEALEAKTRNLDSISYGIMNVLRPYVGRSNLTLSLRTRIETELNGYATELLNGAAYPSDLGPRLLTWEILELRQDLAQRNRLVVTIAVTEPTELNYVVATIVSL